MHGYSGGARSGGSAGALSAAFPLSAPSDSKRLSGWSLGFAGGLSQSAHLEGQFFSPGLYFYEVMLGRGTTFPLLEKNSGIRGFMEFAIRNDRSRSEKLNAPVFKILNRSFPKHQYSLAVRMGATQDLEGDGLVEQRATWISYRLIYSFYVPLSRQLPLMTAHAAAYVRCGFSGFSCGLAGDFMHIWPNKKNYDSTLDLREYFAIGPALRLAIAKRYAVKAQVYWNYYYGATGTGTEKVHQTHFSKSPAGEMDFSVAF